MPDRIIVVGATGLIGSHVVEILSPHYTVIPASRHTTPAIDLMNPASIAAFFASTQSFTHVVVTAGDATFAPLTQLDENALMFGVRNKLLGQIHIALEACKRLPPHGSITLTSGILARKPLKETAGVALVNGGINAFVHAASLELQEGRRINAISPGWIQETMERLGMKADHVVPARDVALAYYEIIKGDATGQVIDV